MKHLTTLLAIGAVALGAGLAISQPKMAPEMERLDVQFSCDDDGICSLYAKDLNEIVRLAQRGVDCR